MATRVFAGYRLFKDNGDVCSDGTITFYLANSTTLQIVYTDKELTISQGSQVSLGSLGVAPDIWVPDTVSIKAIIAGTGVTSDTIDYLTVAASTVAGTTTADVALGNGVQNGALSLWTPGTSYSNISGSGTGVEVADDVYFVQNTAASNAISRQTANGTQSRYCMRVGRPNLSTSTNKLRIWGMLATDEAYRFRGQEVTFSFRCKAGALFSGTSLSVRLATGTSEGESGDLIEASGFAGHADPLNTTQAITTTTTRYEFTCTLSSSLKELGWQVGYTGVGTAGATDYFEIEDIQIEIGSAAASFQLVPEPLDFLRSNLSVGGRLVAASTFTDPGADRVFGWDDSASAFIGFTLPTGLTTSGTALAFGTALADLVTAALTSAELTQLGNINANVISSAQWGYLASVTAAGAALWDDADAPAQRTTLGLGTAATQNTGTSGTAVAVLNGNAPTFALANASPFTIDQNNVGRGLLITGGNSGSSLAKFQRDIGSTGFLDLISVGGEVRLILDFETTNAWGISSDGVDLFFRSGATGATPSTSRAVLSTTGFSVGGNTVLTTATGAQLASANTFTVGPQTISGTSNVYWAASYTGGPLSYFQSTSTATSIGNTSANGGGDIDFYVNSSATVQINKASGGDLRIVAAPSSLATNSAGFRGLGPGAYTNAAYTFVLSDVFVQYYGTGHALTIPPNSSVAFPLQHVIHVQNKYSAGTITIVEGSGVTLRRADGTAGSGTRTVTVSSNISLIKVDTNEWLIIGAFS